MKVSDLITHLKELKRNHGDMDVYMDVPSELGLLDIGEVGVDVEDTGVIFWAADREDA